LPATEGGTEDEINENGTEKGAGEARWWPTSEKAGRGFRPGKDYGRGVCGSNKFPPILICRKEPAGRTIMGKKKHAAS